MKLALIFTEYLMKKLRNRMQKSGSSLKRREQRGHALRYTWGLLVENTQRGINKPPWPLFACLQILITRPCRQSALLALLFSQVIWFNAFTRASFEAKQTDPGFDLQYKKGGMIYQHRKISMNHGLFFNHSFSEERPITVWLLMRLRSQAQAFIFSGFQPCSH